MHSLKQTCYLAQSYQHNSNDYALGTFVHHVLIGLLCTNLFLFRVNHDMVLLFTDVGHNRNLGFHWHRLYIFNFLQEHVCDM